MQLLGCQRPGPDLSIPERVIAHVGVCHSHDLSHALGFGLELWTAQQRSQSGWDSRARASDKTKACGARLSLTDALRTIDVGI